MRKVLQSYVYLGVIAGLVIFLDRVSKLLIISNLAVGERWAPDWLMPYARFVHVQNTGVAFGMFQGWGWLSTIMALIIVIAAIYYFPRISEKDWALRLCLGLILGGAIGNQIDRLSYGYVVDFVSVGNFAVFNVADSAITVGTIIFILLSLIQEYKDKKKASAPEALSDQEQSE